MSREGFHQDPKTIDAVVQNFTVIGEAVRHIPGEVQAAHRGVPWAAMRGMRNAMVHEYHRIDVGVVWQTIQEDLPPLVPLLEAVLGEEEGGHEIRWQA